MSNINTKRLKVTELDFDLIKESFRNYLKGNVTDDGFSFTDYDFEGSGLSVLMDLLAYNTHYNAFYTNMISNEMFLDTTTLRESAVSIAKQLGYTPASIRGSKATVSISFTATNLGGQPVPIPKGTMFTTELDEGTYGFVTTQSYTALPSDDVYTISDVEITEGLYTSVQYSFNSQLNQNFMIPNKNVDTSTITILVTDVISGTSGTVYTLAEDYAALDGNSPVFFLQEVSDELYEVYFGDGNVGKKPADGNIIDISYVISNGDVGNGASIFTSDPISSPDTSLNAGPFSTTITTQTSSAGGASRESIDSIKYLAPRNYEAQNRAVTTDDYKTRIMTDYPQVDAVACWGGEENDPPNYGKVYVSIKPKSGYVVTETDRDYIKKEILKSRNIATVEPIIVDPDYLYLGVDSTIKWDSRLTSLTSETLRAGVTNEILAWAQNNVEKFETYFRYTALLREIDNYDQGILNNITNVTVKKKISPSIGETHKYTMKFSNAIHYPHKGHQGAVTSSTFTYAGYTSCRLSDLDGVIQINGFTSKGESALIDAAAGTVDYVTGDVVLSAFNPDAVDNSGVLSVTIKPDVNDIVPKTNQLITLSGDDLNVVMVNDSSPSVGTQYTAGTSRVVSTTSGGGGTGTGSY